MLFQIFKSANKKPYQHSGYIMILLSETDRLIRTVELLVLYWWVLFNRARSKASITLVCHSAFFVRSPGISSLRTSTL